MRCGTNFCGFLSTSEDNRPCRIERRYTQKRA
jgi:hypothetical protein